MDAALKCWGDLFQWRPSTEGGVPGLLSPSCMMSKRALPCWIRVCLFRRCPLNQRLLVVLCHLQATSPAFAVLESLDKMGLGRANQELLGKFFAKWARVLGLTNGTSVMRETLANMESNFAAADDL